MALSVQTNMGAITAQKFLSFNQTSMNKALERLSSGFRVNNASDDAAGYAIAAKLQGQLGQLQAAQQNAMQATAMVKLADAGVNEIENMVRRLQTLATQAASFNNSQDLTVINAEATKLKTQINNIANGTEYNGIKVLDGTGASAASFQVGVTSAGANQVTADFSKAYTTTGLGINGIDLSTQSAAQSAIATLTAGLSTLTTNRANLGASINQLAYVNANISTSIEQISASISTIKDANMAQEMANFSKSQILTQASTSMLAQANAAAQNILSLFR